MDRTRSYGRANRRTDRGTEGRTNGRHDLEAQEMVIETLIERFGLIKPDLSVKMKGIVNRELLKSLLKLAIRVDSIQEFEEKLKQVEL
ncbi:hypothetical protein JCM12298_05430 [Desulfothermus naphthae]